MPIEALRTPEERFSVLPNFPYKPRYIDSLPSYQGLRMHYVDEGPPDAEKVYLCLHGEPTWCYLYRKMIPVFAATGARVVAPDFFGFGRSDKPVRDTDITYGFHRSSLVELIEALDLKNITLVCQDWGGILGMTLPMDMQQRFQRLIVMNTCLPTGERFSEGFDAWKAYAAQFNDIPSAGLMGLLCGSQMDWFDVAAYGAPFPDARYQAGVRRFPQLVPVAPDMEGVSFSKRARKFWSEEWRGQSFMAIGMQDFVLGKDVMEELRGVINNCPAALEVANAHHFVQEWGEEVARAALRSFEQAAAESHQHDPA